MMKQRNILHHITIILLIVRVRVVSPGGVVISNKVHLVSVDTVSVVATISVVIQTSTKSWTSPAVVVTLSIIQTWTTNTYVPHILTPTRAVPIAIRIFRTTDSSTFSTIISIVVRLL